MKSGLSRSLIGLVFLGFVAASCGLNTSTQSSSSATHRLSGTVSAKAGGLSAQAAPTVTNIVAVTSDGRMTLADLSGGVFSLSVPTGLPVILGFYNGTTLVGYLKQKEVDWDSLPLINPASPSTSLGTVEVTGGTLEATPSIALNDLISNMNLDLSGATYFGKIDDTMTVLSNLDVDGNGLFDFQESDKSYLFWADYGFESSAEVANMLGQFAENYQPKIQSYAYSLIFRNGAAAQAGTLAQLSAPGALSTVSLVGTVDAQGSNWVFGIGYITNEAVPPAGTYTAVVNNGVGTLTFNNFQPSKVSSLGAVNDIIYPVLKLVTNESTGAITGLYYKWKIVRSGTPADATTEEVQTVIEDTQKSKPVGFIHGSPFIELLYDANGSTGSGVIMLDRDMGFVDLTSYNKQYSDVSAISLAYNLSSRAVHRFRFTK